MLRQKGAQKGTELDPNQNQDVVKCVTQLDILSPFNVRKRYSGLSKKHSN